MGSVFVNQSGTAPIDQHNLAARTLKPAAAKLGMEWVSWHVFRHTHSTLTDQLDLTLAERMKILGHSSAQVTMGYTHPELSRIRTQLETMVDPKTLN
jgi:integrase